MAPLDYPPDWKFEPPAIEIPADAHLEFLGLIGKIVVGQSAFRVYEVFKSHFGIASASSDTSWAETDMARAMGGFMLDAVAYVSRFWSALEELRERQIPIPRPQVLNGILRVHVVPLVIEPPLLRLAGADAVVMAAGTTVSAIPRQAHHIILGAQIGQGGFGTVYKATRATSVAPFEYALKLLNPSPFIADHAKAAARFARESRILQILQHRAIVAYYETGMMDANQAYILMPLITGATLRSAPMAVDQALRTMQEVLRGLEYLHGQQVIHRDLKPSNIMIRESDGQPLILDFGCAYLFDDLPEDTLTTALIGSAGYIPPEVHSNPTMRDARQDVYACGIILYELLRGHRPDPLDYAPLTEVIPELAPFDVLVKEAIAPFPKRLPSAREFLDRLVRLAPNAGKSAPETNS